jgi:hypothetical protein
MGIMRSLIFASALIWVLVAGTAEPPRRLLLQSGEADPATAGGTRLGFAIARQADGSFAFYNPAAPSADPLTLPDAMGTLQRLSPALPAAIANSRPLVASGLLLVPHGSFIPHARAEPPTGRHETVIQYSDDGGRTWHLSPSRLTSPCYPGYNGSNEGACEPCFEELAEGRIWMLMRTQAGCLYESFSSDDGTTWSPAAPSRFPSSNSPANLLRHQDGRLVLTWNHCELPPRHAGQGVYGGRDALHIAMSDDEGRTWRGFREIYLDHRRNENPAARGDRGTAYPLAAFATDGTIVVLAGQGHGGRGPILVDPDWVTATAAETDFSDGLAQWSVYRHTGPATRWYRAREVGCVLVETPGEPGTRSLHVRRPADTEAETAVWNFPNGQAGELTL